MYLLNITDQNEITLLEKHFTAWNDLYNYMYNFKKYKLNNIKIDVFKYENIDDLQYIGDFMNIKMIDPETEKKEIKKQAIKTESKNIKNKVLKIILYIIILILTFIISLMNGLTKK